MAEQLNLGQVAAKIKVGKTTTVTPDEEALVVNVGDMANSILNFNIPQGKTGEKGDKGDTGEKGEQGIQGEKGDKGDTGSAGANGLDGAKGDDGKSAYEVYVANGGTLSEADWLESLKGGTEFPENDDILYGVKNGEWSPVATPEYWDKDKPSIGTEDIVIVINPEWVKSQSLGFTQVVPPQGKKVVVYFIDKMTDMGLPLWKKVTYKANQPFAYNLKDKQVTEDIGYTSVTGNFDFYTTQSLKNGVFDYTFTYYGYDVGTEDEELIFPCMLTSFERERALLGSITPNDLLPRKTEDDFLNTDTYIEYYLPKERIDNLVVKYGSDILYEALELAVSSTDFMFHAGYNNNSLSISMTGRVNNGITVSMSGMAQSGSYLSNDLKNPEWVVEVITGSRSNPSDNGDVTVGIRVVGITDKKASSLNIKQKMVDLKDKAMTENKLIYDYEFIPSVLVFAKATKQFVPENFAWLESIEEGVTVPTAGN